MSKTSMKPAPTRMQKAFSFQVKDFDDATGTVKGYLATFDNVDLGQDRIRPGAFKRTLQNKYQYKKANNKTYLMPLLWQHDANTPIGGYTEAKEDQVGLYVEFQVDMDVQRGKEAYSGLKKGYIFQQSIGYDVMQAEYVKDADGQLIRDLLELRLWEGSVVTFPMNEQAVITDVKRTQMDKDKNTPQKKTLLEHFNEETCEDLLEDWQDVYLCALTGAVLDALKIGDQPQTDIAQALDDFKTLVLEKFVAQAVEVGLSDYLQENTYSSTPADYTMQYGSESKPNYGYMSRRAHMLRKAGRAISSANAGAIQGQVDKLNDLADSHTKAMKAHASAIRTVSDDLATILQGSEPTNTSEPGTPDEGQQEGKSSTPFLKRIRALQTPSSQSGDTVAEDELSRGLNELKLLRTQSK